MVESLGTINYAGSEGYQKSFSERTGYLIDQEVRKIIDKQYGECRTIIEERRGEIEA